MDDKKDFRVEVRPVSDDFNETAEQREAREQAEMDLEKRASHPQLSATSISDDPHWRPGYWKRLPKVGFGSLFVVLICAIGCVVTMSFADGKSQTQWPQRLTPNVIVSILNSVANICFGIAISE